VSPEEFNNCRQEILDLVAQRAYQMFESRGRVHGRDWEDWYKAESETLRPVHVELSDDGNELVAVAAVSGYHPDHIRISAEPGRLWICGLPPVANRRHDGSDAHSIGAGPFLRSFKLSAKIYASRVSTEIRNDVLEVHMPKILPKLNG
ncbi:MAG: DUF2934 domain-containing protein, partial [Candidatus Acidiferrales bacterium]